MDLDGIYKKLTGEDLTTATEIPVSPEIDTEISNYLMKNSISSEKDIAEYAKYLNLKNSGGNKLVENDIMEKIFIRVILLKLKKKNV